jgi:GntR family transcriptional regulator/MocR family aminotransferase
MFAEAPDRLFGYGDPRGVAPLRDALTLYFALVRGVRAMPGNVVVCSGFTQSIGLLCRAIAARGARWVAVESYGLPANEDAIGAAGLRAVCVPVDDEGADLGGARADAAIVTPGHQFPLGNVMSPVRRAAVVEWARSAGGFVIEDDYDGEFRFDRQPLGALQGLAPDHVVYAGTVSKTLAPGVRVGWLVLPDALVDPVVAEKTVADRQTGVLDQLVLAQLITSGRYDSHIRWRRAVYRRRRDALAEAVTDAAPACEVRGVSAGLHALVTLPDGIDEAAAVAAGAERGLALQGLATYRLGGSPAPGARPALVIGYATPPDHAFRSALDRLCDVLRSCVAATGVRLGRHTLNLQPSHNAMRRLRRAPRSSTVSSSGWSAVPRNLTSMGSPVSRSW